MRVAEFLAAIQYKQPPAPLDALMNFEKKLGHRLPDDYRSFLIECNGGFVGGSLWFTGPTPDGERGDAGVHHIGGFRTEPHFSLEWHREMLEDFVPGDLLWIMDDPFGNGICVGLRQPHLGKVFFWDHEGDIDDDWDGSVERALNVRLLASSFTNFVAGVEPSDEV